jgi:D-alanyl-D-alanine carboxypeptidase
MNTKKRFFHLAFFGGLAFLLGISAASAAFRFSHALYEKETSLPQHLSEKKISPDLGVLKILSREDSLQYEKNIATNSSQKYIIANLSTQELFLKEGGIIIKKISILSIGKPGSYYETPGGVYSVLHKEKTHFSSIGKVYTDYSIQFFGNFFIHGWPYYKNGTPVPSGFSGGCIRLSNEDARLVYDFASIGGHVIIISNTNVPQKEYDYMLIGAPRAPSVSAKAYLIEDAESGEVLLSENEDTPLPIASLTKLITALTSLDILNQEKEIIINNKKILETEGESGNLYLGQKIKIRDLLYPLLLASSNDAAEALAEVFPRSYFIDQMNKKALAIGMTQTHFEDPSGLSPLNTATAHDLSTLLRYIILYKKYVLSITQQKEVHLEGKNVSWSNNNLFKNEPYYQGGKSGETAEAGKTYLGLFVGKTKDGTERVFSITLLGSEDGVSDIKKLLKYIENHIDAHKIKNTY